MIEGGVPGGSAKHHAGQRRATADRLTLEANWLDTIADDQNRMREALVKLPAAYAVMHDLNVPGSKGTIDHVVVGPGGAFIIVSRRYVERIDYRDGQLWAGDGSMRSVLDGARVEAELMTRALATPVVPVLALLDTLLPAATPGVVDGVVVTSEEYVVRVITRGAHTLLGPDQVYDVAERATPMLHTPQSVPRSGPPSGEQVVTTPDRTLRLPVPQPRSPAPTLHSPSGQPVLLAAPGEQQSTKVIKEQSRHRRSALATAAIVAVLCIVAFAIGSLVRLVWNDGSDEPSSTVESSTDGSTTDGSTTVPPTPPTPPTAPATTFPVMNALPAPLVQYTAVCPSPGVGWDMVPTWPGDVDGLFEYAVEMLITDSWVKLAGWRSATEETAAVLRGQPANATYTIRMTAILVDGAPSANTPVTITAPAEPC